MERIMYLVLLVNQGSCIWITSVTSDSYFLMSLLFTKRPLYFHDTSKIALYFVFFINDPVIDGKVRGRKLPCHSPIFFPTLPFYPLYLLKNQNNTFLAFNCLFFICLSRFITLNLWKHKSSLKSTAIYVGDMYEASDMFFSNVLTWS